ncbi:hypothetical protein CEV32_3954 [Brucella rhizosphaerae]|uniref:Uncharacterized protein n=1 Tax=Brucella rhizosphaerae TaxID=571254 RepID=A0A256FRE0_9HYPH|nr:hypothetical protein CEV32_3954 [Brucella rhizosphaerae]
MKGYSWSSPRDSSSRSSKPTGRRGPRPGRAIRGDGAWEVVRSVQVPDRQALHRWAGHGWQARNRCQSCRSGRSGRPKDRRKAAHSFRCRSIRSAVRHHRNVRCRPQPASSRRHASSDPALRSSAPHARRSPSS